MVKLQDVCYQIGSKTLLHPTSFYFAPQCFHVIMGANGAGKSTLLKVMSGSLAPSAGHIFLQEKDIRQYTRQELAIKRAVLSQQYHIAFPVLVREVVMMGRYPYFNQRASKKDEEICERAMQLMQVEHLRERDYTTLSGGEAQKVQMSRVLAQIGQVSAGSGKVLFLDEPVSNVDVKYQYQLMKVAKEFCKKGVTVIAVLHDINLALSFADRLQFMKNGTVLYQLDNPAAITTTIIEDVFDIPATIETIAHKPIVFF